MNINYYSDIEYAKIIANKVNLTLQFEEGCTPSTNGKYIKLPYLDATWSKSSPQYIDWWYALIHECFHNLHMDDFDLIKDKKIDMKSFLGTIMNLACDFKIENVNRGEFKGRDEIVRKARYTFAKEKIYESMLQRPAPDIRTGIMHAVWIMDALARSPWIPEYIDDDVEQYIKGVSFSEDALEEMLNHSTIFDDYRNQRTAQDTYQVAVDILKLFDLEPEDEGEGSEPESGEGEGEGEGEGTDGEEGDGAKSPWKSFGGMVAGDDHTPRDEKGTPCAISGITHAGSHVDWVPTPIDHKEFDDNDTMYGSQQREADKVHDLCSGSTLSKRIRKELQYLSRTKRTTNQKRGRVHAKSLVKTKTAKTANIFCKKEVQINTKETAVSILVDCSGSMTGNKYSTAQACCFLLSDVLSKLNISHNVLGFTSGYTSNNTTMLHRKEQRKLMFVLSDGQPSACSINGYDGCTAFLKHVVHSIEKSKLIEIMGIGIEDSSVRQFYSKYKVIQDTSELESALFSVLKNKLITGE
jgi:cobalamin biosynthesis protein CobT